MKPTILILAAGAALLHAPLHAQPPGPPPHDPMAMFDANRDGAISLAELQAGSARLFRAIDANGDGRITPDEMRAHRRKLMAGDHGGPRGHMGPPPEGHAGPPPGGPHPPRFEELDSDHDGAIGLAEFQQHLEQHFAMIDANHDGVVTHDELEAAHRAMHPPHP
ncbi:MAG: EF-hand domain-containing protein [Alphaproteobacteria bacterium]|nr:EF-hand domain-containing protein [Alphaproteobacteria bacterium]